MKKLMVILCCLFLCVALYAQNKNDIVNLWEYSAPDAPYGYQSGIINIQEIEGKLTGEINIQGSIVRIQEIKKQDDAYTCTFFLDGQDVDISMKPKAKDQLEGLATSGGMEILFTGKPAKK